MTTTLGEKQATEYGQGNREIRLYVLEQLRICQDILKNPKVRSRAGYIDSESSRLIDPKKQLVDRLNDIWITIEHSELPIAYIRPKMEAIIEDYNSRVKGSRVLKLSDLTPLFFQSYYRYPKKSEKHLKLDQLSKFEE